MKKFKKHFMYKNGTKKVVNSLAQHYALLKKGYTHKLNKK